MPPRNHLLEPEARANALASSPPVRDSATASVRPPCSRTAPTRSASRSWSCRVSSIGTGPYPPPPGTIASGANARQRRAPALDRHELPLPEAVLLEHRNPIVTGDNQKAALGTQQPPFVRVEEDLVRTNGGCYLVIRVRARERARPADPSDPA